MTKMTKSTSALCRHAWRQISVGTRTLMMILILTEGKIKGPRQTNVSKDLSQEKDVWGPQIFYLLAWYYTISMCTAALHWALHWYQKLK